MKTRFKMLVIIFSLAVVCFFQRKSNNVQNDLLFDNIEALAANENIHGLLCIGTGSLNCPIDNSKVAYIY